VALAAGAVYGPHLLMGLYTLAAVSCEHCRVTAWKFLIIAPGVELAVLPAMLFGFRSPFAEVVNLVIASVLSLLILAAGTALLRPRSRMSWILFMVLFLLFALGAFTLLAMIRA
jgi:hypothetical protein